MVGGGEFVEIMGLTPDSVKIDGKLGGVVRWNNFREGFACDNIRVMKRMPCRYT